MGRIYVIILHHFFWSNNSFNHCFIQYTHNEVNITCFVMLWMNANHNEGGEKTHMSKHYKTHNKKWTIKSHNLDDKFVQK